MGNVIAALRPLCCCCPEPESARRPQLQPLLNPEPDPIGASLRQALHQWNQRSLQGFASVVERMGELLPGDPAAHRAAGRLQFLRDHLASAPEPPVMAAEFDALTLIALHLQSLARPLWETLEPRLRSDAQAAALLRDYGRLLNTAHNGLLQLGDQLANVGLRTQQVVAILTRQLGATATAYAAHIRTHGHSPGPLSPRSDIGQVVRWPSPQRQQRRASDLQGEGPHSIGEPLALDREAEQLLQRVTALQQRTRSMAEAVHLPVWSRQPAAGAEAEPDQP